MPENKIKRKKEDRDKGNVWRRKKEKKKKEKKEKKLVDKKKNKGKKNKEEEIKIEKCHYNISQYFHNKF